MQPLTADQVCAAIIAEGQRRNVTPRGQQIALATSKVEASFQIYSNPNDPPSETICPQCPDSFDGSSTGPFQQQAFDEWGGATPEGTQCRMDPTCSAGQFYDHMVNPGKYGLDLGDYNDPNLTPGQVAQAVQRSAFPDRYDQAFTATGPYAGEESIPDLYNRLSGGNPVTPAPAPAPTDPKALALAQLAAARPDYNEYAVWNNNYQDRGGTTIDCWALHTEQNSGYDNADGLAHFLKSTEGRPAAQGGPVSYHYTGSKGQLDDGVTIVDCVDTDYASWSVGNSNNRAINACFANSDVAWTRDEWIANEGRTIDVFAFLACLDAIKYDGLVVAGPNGGTLRVLKPPYDSDPPGIVDHRYFSAYIQDGNDHTDVDGPDGPYGPPFVHFPWDLFEQSVNKYWSIAWPAAAPAPTPDPAPAPAPLPAPVSAVPPYTDVLGTIAGQVLGRWGKLGKNPDGTDRTLVEAVGHLIDKADGTDNSQNGDFSWL